MCSFQRQRNRKGRLTDALIRWIKQTMDNSLYGWLNPFLAVSVHMLILCLLSSSCRELTLKVITSSSLKMPPGRRFHRMTSGTLRANPYVSSIIPKALIRYKTTLTHSSSNKMNWTLSYSWSDPSKLCREMPIKQFKRDNPHPRVVLVGSGPELVCFCVFHQVCVSLAIVCQLSFCEGQRDNMIPTVCVAFVPWTSPLWWPP